MTAFLIPAVVIGFVAGLRSMTAPALVAWAAHLGVLHLEGTPLRFMASPIALALFSFFAIGELIVDKLPFIPKRTDPAPLVIRIFCGAVCGAALSINHSLGAGAVAAALGAIAGAFAGYHTRRRLVAAGKVKDFTIALCEDAMAIGLGLLAL